jgi:lipopolysaccharide/colanic/teichoic acid biosynthesis glycosyltransferase
MSTSFTATSLYDLSDQSRPAQANNYRNMPIRQIKEIVTEQAGEQVWDFINPHLGEEPSKCLLLATSTIFNIRNQPANTYQTIVNLKRINDVRYLNKFFEAANALLPKGGIYINSVQTHRLRKAKLLKRFFWPLNWFVYTIDVILSRVFPKLPITKKIYFFITQGHNRQLSMAETFGRLYSCGFEVLDESKINNELYFIARKIKEPVFDNNPTYGPLIRLKRYGKGGELFGVYKARTMHPYSEYLQEYIFKHNSLDEGGKFKDDFRITTLGHVLRKFWLDELPMLINVMKGQMKIVGVRPLSRHYISLYSDELKKKRMKHKPGLIPPYYADMPKTLEEIMASEMHYLEQYEKSPYLTDFNYFFKALYNILIKRARSK